MNGITAAGRILLAGTISAAVVGVVPDLAQAAYSARVEAGTLTLRGDSASDRLALRLQPGSPGTLQADVGADGSAEFSFDRATFTSIDVEAGGGSDEVRIDQSGGAFTDESVTMNGGAGDDTLIGGAGAETFIGGTGEDVADGNIGADQASLGAGDDRFQWDPGDGSDAVDGQAGTDQLDFNGSNASEQIAFTAGFGRVLLTRDIGSITMDLDGIERVDLRSLGGNDTTTVNQLAGTELELVDVDLDAFVGGGDGAADTVVAQGTAAADKVSFSSPDGLPVVDGLGAQTRVRGGEAALDNIIAATLGGDDTATSTVGVNSPIPLHIDGGEGNDSAHYNGSNGPDQIALLRNGAELAITSPASALFETANVESTTVSGLDGDDTIAASNGLATLTSLTLEGGDGDDDLRGGDGADTLNGGKGNDSADGNIGADQASLGAGDDRFQWDPGDGSDTVDGQAGTDQLDFNGSNAGEEITLGANGDRARLTRNIASISMDLNELEAVNIRALGSTDTVTVDDLAGTDVKDVDVDLGAFGGGDGVPDSVVVNGTDRRDVIQVTRSGERIAVAGLAAEIGIGGSESLNDTLRIQTLDGDDDVAISPDVELLISLVVNLGPGE
jgi:Ca2+-binding RTX toxin-like protein